MAAGQAPSPLRVEVLGALRLLVEGAAVDVRGVKRRAVLALLALAESRTVTVDSLVDALWPTGAPESGRAALHSHVSRLRGQLGPAADRLETRPDGYRLALAGDELDVAQARAMLAEARNGAPRDPAPATALLREAHGLWRGPVLADLVHVGPIATAAEACAILQREVTDALVGTAIAAGKASDVLALAAASRTEDPLREPAVLLLMRALATTGDAPEALRIGREYRHRLAEETGLDASPALDELERDIAGGALGPPAPVRPGASPRPATRLIGRETEVAALHRLLAAERLVTLVGPGGVGKTRVALEVARRDATTTVLLLAPVTDPGAVPHALAAALGLTVVQGDVLAACLAVLGDRRGLLVVDNCEHLLGTVRDLVGAVLASCPQLSVLATSRERLGLAAEHASRLSPLPLPGPGQDPARVPSVALFLDRARRVRPGPPPPPAELRTIADIVHRLDGMPLAIELAAGRLSSFSLGDLRGRLDRSLDLLGGGAPSGDARHRTLRAAVAWSYDLLSEDERRLFRYLSVFVDGVDLDTAERLATDLGLDGDPGSLLARLVDASVLEADVTTGTRYRMLETLRAFGLDRLAAAGEHTDAVERMLRWAVGLTQEVGAALTTDREAEADRALRRELANLRVAWRSARGRGRLDAAVAMVSALTDAIAYRDVLEVRGWAEELAGDPALLSHPHAGTVLAAAAEAAYHRGDHPEAERLARTGLERAVDDADACFSLEVLAVVALARGSYTETVDHALAAAARAPRTRDTFGIAALAAAYAGDLARARALNERGRADAGSPSMRSWGAYVDGEIENLAGRSQAAEEHYLRAIELARDAGATFLVGVATVGLLTVRAGTGRVPEALAGYRDVIDYFDRTGNWTHQWATLRNLADLLRRLGDDRPATVIDAAADAAPDAPADDRRTGTGTTQPAPGRTAVLELARRAIAEHLTRP